MEENESDSENERSSLAKFTGIAFQMIAIIGIFAFAGYKIDMATNHHTKWVTALLSLIGVFISLYIVIKSIKK
ncbi:MAG: AtpZ/AtpI family protein [Mucilaginibacter sp.]|uniref:AtpZ/AtpI family protein n=1 Tax=Mucilaginibacter sp. TaxID=1882438 RepID=UPI00260E29C4|nr:AtpZ/AtpI family protein [Mucilaginibacter sp.]MDB5002247.1 AtpZ/AtpI family protein [Mucilaginibacter sp.]